MLCERECASTGNGDVMRCCAKENAPTKANSGAYPTHVLRSSKSAWHRPCCSPSLSLCTLTVQLSHRAQSIPFTPAVRPPFTVHCQSSSLRNRAMFRSSPQHSSETLLAHLRGGHLLLEVVIRFAHQRQHAFDHGGTVIGVRARAPAAALVVVVVEDCLLQKLRV